MSDHLTPKGQVDESHVLLAMRDYFARGCSGEQLAHHLGIPMAPTMAILLRLKDEGKVRKEQGRWRLK